MFVFKSLLDYVKSVFISCVALCYMAFPVHADHFGHWFYDGERQSYEMYRWLGGSQEFYYDCGWESRRPTELDQGAFEYEGYKDVPYLGSSYAYDQSDYFYY